MIFDAPDSANANHRQASLMVEELVRCGVDTFFLAPGSRSTALTAAVAAHPQAHAVMHFDERGTAFAALGYGRATGRPAAWITTSGTAVANGLPAVVEAAVDHVPLLLLTADRPPELRDTGANQTIAQVGLFGSYVRWAFDLPAPDAAIDPAMVLTTVDQAVYRARRSPAGPVHLNTMFREPLAPQPDGRPVPEEAGQLARWRASEVPYTRYAEASLRPDADALDALATRLQGVTQGLVVAGRLRTAAEGAAAAHLAAALGWPLLPDIASQVRLGPLSSASARIDHFDAVLADPAFAAAHAPEAVVYVGDRATSKRLLQYLERHRPPYYVVLANHPSRFDPRHQVTDRLEADIVAGCTALAERFDPAAAPLSPWTQAWQDASAAYAARLDGLLADEPTLSEPRVSRLVARHLSPGHALVLGSSMPVRDVDTFAPTDGPVVPVATNRGASGIDGTLATAAGFAQGHGGPTTVLLGDLSVLHDLNSLALLRGRPVTVVAINNDGGGIFHFLPIAAHTALFEPYFGTPHGLTFEAAAKLFGLAYAQPTTPEAFVAAYTAAAACGGPTLIEVRTDRVANHALHHRLLGR